MNLYLPLLYISYYHFQFLCSVGLFFTGFNVYVLLGCCNET